MRLKQHASAHKALDQYLGNEWLDLLAALVDESNELWREGNGALATAVEQYGIILEVIVLDAPACLDLMHDDIQPQWQRHCMLELPEGHMLVSLAITLACENVVATFCGPLGVVHIQPISPCHEPIAIMLQMPLKRAKKEALVLFWYR